MKAKEIMSQNIVALDENESVLKAAQGMEKNNVGTVLVTSGGNFSGILNDRQITCKCVAPEKDPSNTSINEVMTKDPRSGTPDMDILEAARVLGESHFRRLPIIDNGKPVGVLSVADLAEQVKDLNTWIFEEISKSKKGKSKKEMYYYGEGEVKARK
ncbi:MAG: CBS domain-containing protein [Archaeoglobaceae archaeon]